MEKATISGTVSTGVSLTSAVYTNPVTITSGAKVLSAISAATDWTIQNNGYIASANRFGIALSAGGAVTNAAGGMIDGYGGISVAGAAGTVANAGVILSAGDAGVSLKSGGSVTNAAGGSIYSALYAGLYGGASTTVCNNGNLGGLRFGVVLRDGGSVTNAAGASIYGVADKAIYLTGRAFGSVLNSGSIYGYNFGVYLFDQGGSVTNTAGGSISGKNRDGVISLGPATVANAGVITGATDAVYFDGAGANRLIVSAGAVFNGAVKAVGGGANVIELTSSANAARLSGLGSEYVGFQSVTIDSGAAWTVAATKGGFAGVRIAGFNSKDALDVTDVAFAAGDTAVANASGMLTVSNAKGTVLATVALSGNQSAVKFAVSADGTGGLEIEEAGAFVQRSEITGTHAIGIALTPAGYTNPVTVTSTARISAALGPALLAQTSWSVRNNGTVSGLTGAGIDLAAGGSLANAGSISSVVGAAVFVGAGGMITNSAGGRITGVTDGIAMTSGGTVENAGTIGGAVAIAFNSTSAHRLIADDGGVFNGVVTAAGNANTLEMTVTALGTHPAITGFGTKFTGFQTLQFDKGAAWEVSGSFAGLQTIAGFHPGDKLDLTWIAYATGETIDVSSSSRLEIRNAANVVVWSALLLNVRYRANVYGKCTFHVAKDGTGGSLVTVTRNVVAAAAAAGLVSQADQVTRFVEAVAAGASIPDGSAGPMWSVHPEALHQSMLAISTR